jgi:hypothetical protein
MTDLLDRWIAENARSPMAAAIRHVAEWLQHTATPDDWHRTVTALNWTYGTEPFQWIVRQPQCDKATALTAFYWARPGQYLDESDDLAEVDPWKVEYLVLIEAVRTRFMASFYTRAELAFDGASALADEAYLPPDPPRDRLDAMIPPEMRVNLPGRVLSEEFDSRPLMWPR